MTALQEKSTIIQDADNAEHDDDLNTSTDLDPKSINVQSLYNKIESIKSTVSMANAERPELWIQRQNLQDLYHQIILNDIEFTIDKKLEQDLWNLVFKNQISYFQSQIKENSLSSSSSSSSATSSLASPSTSQPSAIKNKMAQKKLEAQANLSFFLEAARGFYTKLLEDLVKKYNLNELKKDATSINVSFYQRFPALFDQMSLEFDQIETTKEKQILYICQHTLTHLGDIARYSSQFEEAKNYYLHAIKLVPYLGHPYNQLGILFETSRTNQLSTVFYYVRSISTRYTFPLASTNLENFFHKLIDTQISRYNSQQLSHKDLLTLFLQLNAILHSLQTGKNSKSLNSNPTKLKSFYDLFKMSFQNFIQSPQAQLDKLEWSQFCYIISIVIFQMTLPPTQLCQTDAKMKENYDAANKTSLDLYLFFVNQFIQFTVKNPKSDLVLPSLYLSFSFMESYKNGCLISENTLTTYNEETVKNFDNLVNFLNSLNSDVKTSSLKRLDYPLIEDRMLDGFLPFKDVHKNLAFKKYMSNNQLMEDSEEKVLRKKRIIGVFEKLAAESCYLKIDVEGEVKFLASSSYPFKLEEPEVKPIEQAPRRRRQNIALSSMTGDIEKKPVQPNNLLLTRPIAQPPRFPMFSQAPQRFIPNQQWQQPVQNFNNNNFSQSNETFFPSASARQFPIQMPNRNIVNPMQQPNLNNGFPSFLPNEKMNTNEQINQLNSKFNQIRNTQFAPPGFQTDPNESYLSNMLIQQLMTNNRNEPKNNTFEYNLNMINYMQINESLNQDLNNPMSSNNSIWSYPKAPEQNFK